MAVYFIREEGDDGLIKIGTTTGNPHSRKSALQTGNPRPLRLLVSIPGGPTEEKALHERFAAERVRSEEQIGTEWFRPSPMLLGFIEGLTYTFRDQQSEPEPDRPDLYGLTWEQVHAVTAVVRAEIAQRRAIDWLEYSETQGGKYELDADEGFLASYDLERLDEMVTEGEGCPYNVGIRWFLANVVESDNKDLRDRIDRELKADNAREQRAHDEEPRSVAGLTRDQYLGIEGARSINLLLSKARELWDQARLDDVAASDVIITQRSLDDLCCTDASRLDPWDVGMFVGAKWREAPRRPARYDPGLTGRHIIEQVRDRMHEMIAGTLPTSQEMPLLKGPWWSATEPAGGDDGITC